MGYPGIVLDEKGVEISGYIFTSEQLDDHWDELDEFEGQEYQRVLIKARTKDKIELDAYIYRLKVS
jgi:gamma-glutamylcyclotransferase (GGCT)/AIG2-like uncharacterized protein YtfP